MSKTKLKITLTKSMIGRPEKHRKILRGMGLAKLNRSVSLSDSASVRGMLKSVLHLVKVEELKDETA